MKMEPTVSSETSAIRTQTSGNYPKRNKLRIGFSSKSVATTREEERSKEGGRQSAIMHIIVRKHADNEDGIVQSIY